MSYLINNQQKINDIIFANRNKSYGAYEMRSTYGSTMLKSLLWMISSVATIFGLGFYFAEKAGLQDLDIERIIVHDSVYVIPFRTDQKEEVTKEVKKETPAAGGSEANKNKALPVIIDSLVSQNTVSVTTEVSNQNQSSTNSSTTAVDSSSSSSHGAVASIRFGKEIKSTYEIDSEPQFEGGLKALYKFISSNVHYPPRALEEQIEGIVFVKFVVDEEGKVGTLSLLNNLGYGLDEEALRVVNLLPKFKTPGMVAGQPVKVYYQLPIKYTIR